jgi:1-pyrroline-5-carboxylate dehydrogenase
MSNAIFHLPVPHNEPVLDYAPGTPERDSLKKAIQALSTQQIEIPLIIGGEEVRTANPGQARMLHNHHHVLGTYHKAGGVEVQRAIEAASAAWHARSTMPWEARAAVLLKAADILTCQRRDEMTVCAWGMAS